MLIKKRRVCDLTSLSATSIDRLVREEQFPLPTKLLNGRVAWELEKVLEWIRRRIKEGTPIILKSSEAKSEKTRKRQTAKKKLKKAA